MKLEQPMEKVMHLLVERIAAIPCPAIIDDLFKEAGIGMIWIPQANGQQHGTLRDWSAAELKQIDTLVHVAGGLIASEMRRSGYPIIQRQFDNGSSVVLYRRDLEEEARKLCRIVTLQ